MFKKPASRKPQDALSDRLKAIAERKPADQSYYRDIIQKKDRAQRLPTFKQAHVMMATGERLDVVIKNITDYGARIEFIRRTHLSDRIHISEPTLPLNTWAQVIWQSDGAAGVLFITR
jgi:hypothetical protein